jgi:hypothetical protein
MSICGREVVISAPCSTDACFTRNPTFAMVRAAQGPGVMARYDEVLAPVFDTEELAEVFVLLCWTSQASKLMRMPTTSSLRALSASVCRLY